MQNVLFYFLLIFSLIFQFIFQFIFDGLYFHGLCLQKWIKNKNCEHPYSTQLQLFSSQNFVFNISTIISLDLRDWMLNQLNYARLRILKSVRNHSLICPCFFCLTSPLSLSAASNLLNISLLRPCPLFMCFMLFYSYLDRGRWVNMSPFRCTELKTPRVTTASRAAKLESRLPWSI